MEQQGMPTNSKSKLPTEMFQEEASRRVKLGLLINKIATDSEIKPEKEQVDAKLNEMSLQYGESAQQMIDCITLIHLEWQILSLWLWKIL